MFIRIFFCCLSVLILCASLRGQSGRVVVDFNKEWRFRLGGDSAVLQNSYDDSKWRLLNLPHDWSIELPFDANSAATTQGGALSGGIGWYRKTFVSPAAQGQHVSVEFDGIYRNSEVWINGHWLGRRPYGYSSFSYDLDAWLLPPPAKNTMLVKVDNSQQPNSRWYSGSGIYRNTRLVVTSPIAAIAHWGSFISTPRVTAGFADIDMQFEIAGRAGQKITIETQLIDPAGKKWPVQTAQLALNSERTNYRLRTTVKNPLRWSVNTPRMYRAHTVIRSGTVVLDTSTTWFGIRSFRFDPDKGFFLNDQPLKILGVCNHHDLGALGAAVNMRAIERQLELLKAMGCNAIRTAHNPAAPELLDLCDRMGFLVLEEAFDMWRKKKNKYDYSMDYDQWHAADITDMVLRDRNHPSIFMWSIGNEIREQFDSSGIRMAKELVELVKQADSTRPVTAALSEWNPEKNFLYQSGALDVVGLNYHQEVYADFHKYYPGKIFLGTENMSAFATRGHYDLPSDSSYFWPAKSPQKIVEKGNPDFTVSAYDQVSAYWGSTHEATWKIIRQHAFLSGLFVWSGFDFIGEPIPYPWPARSAYYGIIDLAGFPKDVYYMYQSEWTHRPVLHLFPHWNWKPGQLVDVWAYYNQADEVELFLNGRSLGIRKKTDDDLHVMWRIPFEAGTLRAVSRKKGRTVLTKEIHTAGAPARISLEADRTNISTGADDCSFVTVRILDKEGNLVPDAANRIQFTVEGPGIVKATDNGWQADTVAFSSSTRSCWKGMALAVVAAKKQGNITLRAFSKGLPVALVRLKTKEGRQTFTQSFPARKRF